MPDGQVIITLSLQDAETVRRWQAQRANILEVERAIGGVKKATQAALGAQQQLSKAQSEGWSRLSAMGKQALDSQSKWGRGMAVLAKQQSAAAWEAAQDAQAALGKQGTAASKLRATIKGIGTAARASGRAMGSMASDSVAARWLSLGSAIGVAATGMRSFATASEEVLQAQAEIGFALDETFRKFAAQAGIGELGRKDAQTKLLAMAERQATEIEVVEPIARQLVSSGYTVKQVLEEGGVAESMVATMRAAAVSGKEGDFDAKRMGEAATQFLLAQGGAEQEDQRKLPEEQRAELLSNQKFDQLMRDVHALYQNANLQFEDLQEFAKAAPALARAGIDMRTQLALATQMRDILPAEEAATSLRNIVQRTRTAGAHKEKVEALASIGLTPEDVDLEGEGIDEVLKRYRDALSTVSKKQADTALLKIFEQRGAQGAAVLIEQADQLAMFREKAADHSKFEIAHEEVTTGPAAAKTRANVQKQRKLFDEESEGVQDALFAQEIANLRRFKGEEIGPKRAGLLAAEYKALRKASLGFVSPKTALLTVLGGEASNDVVRQVEANRTGQQPEEIEVVGQTVMAGATPAAKRERAREQRVAQQRAEAPRAPDAAEQQESEERRQLYAQRAQQFADEAIGKQAEKEVKWHAAEVAKLFKAGQAALAKYQREQNTVEKRAERASAQASKQGAYAAADQRRIDELKRRMGHAQSRAAEPTTVERQEPAHLDRHVTGGTHHRKAPRGGSTGRQKPPTRRQQEASQEEQRRLRVQLEELTRKQDTHLTEQRRLQEEANRLLAQLAGKKPTTAPPPRGTMAQRPPASIGGN